MDTQPSLEKLLELINREIPPEEAERLDIKVEPKLDEISARQNHYVLIRHGFSIFNLLVEHLKPQKIDMDDEGARSVRLDRTQADSDLHTIGIYQALRQQDFLNQLDFQIVFVSPLKRALETTYLMFKNHPRRQQIKFIVVPHLTEGIGMASSLALETTLSIRQQYSNLEGGISFDFSLFDELKHPRLWFLEVLENKGKAQELIEQLHGVEDQSSQAIIDKILEVFNQIFPRQFESRDELFQRVSTSKNIIKELVGKHFAQGLQGEQKVGIVAHAVFLRCFTGEGIVDGVVQGGIRFGNCQIAGTEL